MICTSGPNLVTLGHKLSHGQTQGWHTDRWTHRQTDASNDNILRPKLASVYSLGPGDAIWRHGTRSTLAQVMASCLMAPSHYLNQYWLIIGEVPWHSSQGIIFIWWNYQSMNRDWKLQFQNGIQVSQGPMGSKWLGCVLYNPDFKHSWWALFSLLQFGINKIFSWKFTKHFIFLRSNL